MGRAVREDPDGSGHFRTLWASHGSEPSRAALLSLPLYRSPLMSTTTLIIVIVLLLLLFGGGGLYSRRRRI
jgi:hypothetical protein